MTKHHFIQSNHGHSFATSPTLASVHSIHYDARIPHADQLFVTVPLADGTNLILCDTGHGWKMLKDHAQRFDKPDNNQSTVNRPDRVAITDNAAPNDCAPSRHVAVLVLQPSDDEDGTDTIRDAWLFCRLCHRWSNAPETAQGWPHVCRTTAKAKGQRTNAKPKLRLVQATEGAHIP
jgi:hypothetical protein